MPRRRAASNASTTTASTARDNVPPSPYHGPQEMASMYDYLAKIILLGPSGCGKSCLLHRFVKNEWRVLSSQTIGVEFASRIIKIGDGTNSPGRNGGPGRRKRIKLQLWDTAGTERFRSVSRSYYRGAAGAILVYDVCNQKSFAELGTFLNDARALASPQLSCVVVGNKNDLVEEPGLAQEVQGQAQQQTSSPSQSGASLLDEEPFGSISSRTGTIGPGLGSQLRATTVEASTGRAVSSSVVANWANQNRIPAAVEVSALSGDGVEEVFNKLARIILTKIELGEIDPDDPMSGIQYGDADFYRYDDGGSSIKSGGLTSDGYGSTRRRRKRAGWGGVFKVGRSTNSSGGGGGGGGKCC